jgi:uncharacterized protein YndB with AHSA1/START domain
MSTRRSLFVGLLLALATLSAPAHGPSRQKVTKDITINAPAAKVWTLVADFCSISEWHPAVAECTGTGGNAVGATRVLRIGAADGPTIAEELQTYDASAMSYKYKISKTDNAVLPVNTYSAFLTVIDNGDNTSRVEWKAGFYRAFPNNNPPPELSDEAAVRAVTGVYEAGLANLKKLAEQK